MTRKFILLLVLGLIGGRVWSQAAITGTAYAEIIAALTANETTRMHFGKFSPEVQGGQIILSPDGNRTTNGSVILGGGISQPGVFTITGQPDATFSIQLPQQPAYLTRPGTNNTMMISEWQSDPPAGQAYATLESGIQLVSIGATLNVGSIQDNPVGMYTGTFNVTFAYN